MEIWEKYEKNIIRINVIVLWWLYIFISIYFYISKLYEYINSLLIYYTEKSVYWSKNIDKIINILGILDK